MPIMNDKEQWKIYGQCEKCRRQGYCSKDCKKKKERPSKDVLSGIPLEEIADVIKNIKIGDIKNEE